MGACAITGTGICVFKRKRNSVDMTSSNLLGGWLKELGSVENCNVSHVGCSSLALKQLPSTDVSAKSNRVVSLVQGPFPSLFS